MIPSPEWAVLLEPLQPYFTQPGFRYFRAFVIILAQIDGRLWVTHVVLANLVDRHFTGYYRFLKEGAWSLTEVGQAIASLALQKCWPKDALKSSSTIKASDGSKQRVFAAIDDTVAAKFGKHFAGLGVHHDPMNRDHPKRLSSGHCFVCLALIAEQAHEHYAVLFLRAALYVQEKACQEADAFATKLQLAVRLLQEVQTPEHVVLIAVADGAYAKKTFIQGVFQTGRHVLSRLRGDTVFYDPPPEPVPGQRGRPRKFGDKHKAREWAREATDWREITVCLYGKTATLKIKSRIALHRRLDVTMKIVAVCWQQPSKQQNTTICHSPVFLFSTDTELTEEEIVRAYGSRFCIETGFRDAKQSFGFSTYQVRCRTSIERLVHLCLWSQTLLRIRFFDAKPQPIYGDWRKPLSYLTLSQQKEAAKHQDGAFDTSIENDQSRNKSGQMEIA